MGKDLLRYSADKVVSELGISHVPEGRRLFENLTVMENLRLATFARKDHDQIERDIETWRTMMIQQQMKGGNIKGSTEIYAAGNRHIDWTLF